MNIRIGKTPYLNALPFYEGLPEAGYEFVEGPPSRLNELIRQGALDISLVSSLEYAKNPEKYWVLPDLSISAKESSESVVLIFKGELSALKGREIFFTRESFSSVALLDILLKERFEIDASLTPFTEGEEDLVEKGEALLVIGDRALEFRRRFTDPAIHYYDLATFWWEWMKRPFCFALWVTRREFFDQHPEAVRKLGEQLRTQINSYPPTTLLKSPLERGPARGGGVCETHWVLSPSHTPSACGGHPSQEGTYLSLFTYTLTPEILQGLFLFYERAAKLGWIKPLKNVEFVPCESLKNA